MMQLVRKAKPPLAHDIPHSLYGWRQQILQKLRYVVLLLILPIIVSGMFASYWFGQPQPSLIASGLLLLLLIVAAAPGLASGLRSWLLVGLLLVLSAYGLLSFGRLGVSPYFGMLAVVFAVALSGRRAALLTLALEALLVLVIYGGFASGLIPPPMGMDPVVQPWPLFSTGLNILVLVGVLTLVLIWMVDTAERSLHAVRASHAALDRLRNETEALVAVRDAEARQSASLHRAADVALGRQLRYAEALSRCSQALLTPIQVADERQAILSRALEALRVGIETRYLAIYQPIVRSQTSLRKFRLVSSGDSSAIEEIDTAPSNPSRSRLVAHAQVAGADSAPQSEIEAPPELAALLAQGQWFGGSLAECFPARPEWRQPYAAREIGSLLWMPLQSSGRYWGQLEIADSGQPHAWDEQTIRLLRTASEMIAAALEGWEVAAALRAREAQIRSIAANLPNGMIYRFVQYPDGTVAFPYNDGAVERLTGYTAQQIADQPALLLNTIVESDRARYEAAVAESAQNLTVFEFETQRRMADGSLCWVQFYSTPQRLPDRSIAWDGIQMDITLRKQAEQELDRAWRAAEAAARTKSEFVAQISHEIRTPLNTVIGLTTLLLASPLSAAQRDDVETIRRSGNALLTLIDDILDFSKVEAGRLALEYQPFGLRACVEEALDLLAPLADAKHLALRYSPDPALPEMFIGDPARLRQILVNLLSNAVRFTEHGAITLGLTGRPRKADGDGQSTWELAISVQDTGVGIAPEYREQIFQSFFQVSPATGQRYGGTGLGLTISRRLAELMDGQIQVDSASGRGSTFTVALALEVADAAPPPYLTADQPALNGKSALLLVDQAEPGDRLAEQLGHWQIRVTVCASAAAAISWLRVTQAVDMVLIAQEHQDGAEEVLIAEIRAAASRPALPVVLGVAVSQRGRILGQLDLATTVVLPLPLRPVALYDALHTLLGAAASALSQSQVALIDAGMGTRFPLRILLAEDNAINQQVAQRLLAKLGYAADLASTGLEVLEALRRQRYDLVLMDVQMPAMSGTEATQYIRSFWPRQQQPRIAAMTAYASEENRNWLINTGIDDFVRKPVRLEELVRVLQETSRVTSAFVATTPNNPGETRTLDATLFADFLQEAGSGEAAEDRAFLASYSTEMASLVLNLRVALAADDGPRFTKIAHTLRGLSLQIGALELAFLCGQLEAGGLAVGQTLLANVDAAWEALYRELDLPGALRQS